MVRLESQRMPYFAEGAGKNDSPVGRRFCYRSPGTRLKDTPRRDGTERFPIQTGDRSDLNLECGFGACTETFYKAKLNIIRYLFNSATIPKFGAASLQVRGARFK